MREWGCCFTGHRNIEPSEIGLTEEAVLLQTERLICEGYRYFYTGGALGFDTLAARCVLRLRIDYPDIRLILVLPCIEQTRGWKPYDIAMYEDIKANCDEFIYSSLHYFRGCMHVRNRYLVDSSSVCISYLLKDTGGTAYTVDYANSKNLRVINVAQPSSPRLDDFL